MKTYRTNNNNNLLIEDDNSETLINGYFDVIDNDLYYIPTDPLEKQNQIKFKGQWQLNNNHDLIFRLSGTTPNQLFLKGEIINVDDKNLIFAIESRISQTKSKINTLKLTGQWMANSKNQIVFSIERKKAVHDKLTFKGDWTIDKNYKISYVYEKTDLFKKTKCLHTLIFTGVWDISSNKKIRFIINKNSKSVLEFRASLETPNIYAKKGTIKYRIGVGTRKREKFNDLILFGGWRISNKFGIDYTVFYNKDEKFTNSFTATYNFSKQSQIKANLKTKDNQLTGITLIFTKSFFKDDELFFSFKKDIEEKAFMFGYTVKF